MNPLFNYHIGTMRLGIYTRSLALKGHGIQGSLVKILPKIRVTFSSQLVKVKGLRVNP